MMDYYEFYKELYHKENDRRQEVINALNIPLAIITALATVVYILTTTFSYTVHWLATSLFVSGIVATVGFLVRAIYDLSHAFVNLRESYEYTGIPFSKELFDYRKTLRTFVIENYGDEPDIEKKTDEFFQQYLVENFVEHIDHNTFINDQKHRFIFNSKRYLIYCLICCLLTLPPFLWGYFGKKDEIHKVELIQQNQQSRERSESAQATAAATGATATTAASTTAEQIDQRRQGTAKAARMGKEAIKAKPIRHGQQPTNSTTTTSTITATKSSTATSSPK